VFSELLTDIDLSVVDNLFEVAHDHGLINKSTWVRYFFHIAESFFGKIKQVASSALRSYVKSP
jgi:hypothetical protein